jgi:Flp pilus assembly protein TadG
MAGILRRFADNTSGNFGMWVALMITPLMGTAAAAVEYSKIYQARTHLQHALDTAALATAKELANSSDENYLRQYARDFFDSNLDPEIDPQRLQFGFAFEHGQTGGTNITLTADYNYDAIMGALIGFDELDMDVSATVAAGNRTVEVAIVIDNSGSMDSYSNGTSSTRIELARQAATNLVNSLHTVAALSNKPDPVRISVVPFGSSVNIGPHHRGAPWMDMLGWSSIHHENFDWIGTDTRGDSWPGVFQSGSGFKSNSTTTSLLGPSPTQQQIDLYGVSTSTWLSRWTLYDALNVNWAGCVEMRPWPYHSTDAAPDDVNPDTLYVPMFAPDESDRINSNEDSDYRNSYLNDYRRPGPDYSQTTWTYGNFTKQLWRESWTRKYNNDAKWSSSEASGNSTRQRINNSRSRDFGQYDPNQTCTTDPLTPLTDNKQTVLDAIAAMDAGGYTNVQEGIAWGWRTLSSGTPFTEGRAYSVPENDKYLIILTDGNNTYPTQNTWNETEYYPWGYGRHDRIRAGLPGTYDLVTSMNMHTKNTCDNIKMQLNAENREAIRIFTIAYDVPNGSSVKNLLYDCASVGRDGKKYYYDVSGNAIAAAMAAIGNEISDLRIAR